MKPSRASLSLSIAAALLAALALDARADEAANKAAAQALYDQGIKLMAAGKLTEACKKLEDSGKLFDGLGTKGRLGECYEKSKRLASAWVQYRGALSLAEAKADPRAAELRARVASLEPRLSRLKIDVPATARVPGLKITRDGTELPEALWGTSLPVDGGVHMVEATSPGGSWKGETKVKEEHDDATIVVTLEPTRRGAPEAPPSATPPAASTQAPPPAPVQASARRTTGLIVGGVGLVGLAVGGYFGLKTINKNSDSNADGHCNAANVCDKLGTSLRNDAKSAALLSDVFVGVGAAALVGGVVLFVSAPRQAQQQSKTQLTPLLGPGGGGFALSGSW